VIALHPASAVSQLRGVQQRNAASLVVGAFITVFFVPAFWLLD